MTQEGETVSISQACKWSGLSRRSFYYQPTKAKPKVNEHLANRIKHCINAFPHAGYRTVAWMLGENKNTVQRIFQLKGWEVRKRKSGARPRVQSKVSVACQPNRRWATDMCRVWCGRDGWCLEAIMG